MKIPFLYLKEKNRKIKEDFHCSLDEILNNGNYILGEQVKAFEEYFCSFVKSKYAIGVSNCHDGLEIILKAIGVGKDDEVIVPSNTFIATWLAVINCGANIVPVEPNIDTFNIDPKKIKSKISPKTKAIIMVHLYGRMAQVDEIKSIAKENNLFLIEDAAQAIGSKFKGIDAGSAGDAASFSFYPTKNLGALGDAGIVTTSNKDLYEKIKRIRNYGSLEKYKNDFMGRNSRLDEIQASFLRKKITFLNQENAKRDKLARRYLKNLFPIREKITLPFVNENYLVHSWHLFVILVDDRESLANYLFENGIETLYHYPIPPHKQKCFKKSYIYNFNLPISEKIHNSCISLPISGEHNIKEIDYVSNKILDFYK